MASKRPTKIAPENKFRIVGFDFFEPAEYGPAEWIIKDCENIKEAKVAANEWDNVWTAARIYDDKGKQVYATRTADMK